MIVAHKYSDITEWFCSTLKILFQQQQTVTISLSGGHSLDGWYTSILADSNAWKGIDISRLRWCVVDERCVAPDSLDRNDSYVWNVFLKPLGFQPAQFLCLGTSEVDALEYSEIIGIPDMALFGLGPDGHIASLFPCHPLLSAHVEGYVHISDAPKMPPERITLTVPAIQKISHTALFAVGTEKQQAFDALMDPHKTPFECPGKFLDPDIIFRI